MTELEKIEVDYLFDLLIEKGFNVDISKVKEMFEVYSEMFEGCAGNREYEFVDLGAGLKEKKCNKCIQLQKEIDRLERKVWIYGDNIKQSLKCNEVWIDGKKVMYR